MANPLELQTALLEKIIARFPRRSHAASVLEEVLSLGRDSIARRLRGDTALTPQEIQTLALHFDISLDEIVFGSTSRSIFSYNLFENPISNFLDYLKLIHKQISIFQARSNFQVRYATREIPIFIYMMFPRLLSFKLYVYGMTTWGFKFLEDRDFSFDLLTTQELQIANETSRMYCETTSKDYWTVTILEQTLNQLEYMIVDGRINNQDIAFALINDLEQMVLHAQAMAKQGQKFLPGDLPSPSSGHFELYYNEFADTNNMILATSDNTAGLYHTFDTPNYLFTSDQRICKAVENWFDTTLGNSVMISVHSGKNRNHFFNRLNTRINLMKKRLELIFE